jgi:magnesium-transporting ATPase (P-type)
MENKDDLSYLSVEALLARLKSSQSGLTSQEAENRLKIYGYNELAKRKERFVIVEFLLRFKSPLVIILLLAGLISGLTGEIVNAAIIFLA